MRGTPDGKHWKSGSFESISVVFGPVGRFALNFSSPHCVRGRGPFHGFPWGSSQTNCCPGLSGVAAPRVEPLEGYQTPLRSAPGAVAGFEVCDAPEEANPRKASSAIE